MRFCGQVSLPTFELGLPAYYVLALSEASSNLSRYDGVRYGLRATEGAAAADLRDMYTATRGEGLGAEVKRRILMGTYALSAGYYDAYYKRAQQVGGGWLFSLSGRSMPVQVQVVGSGMHANAACPDVVT